MNPLVSTSPLLLNNVTTTSKELEAKPMSYFANNKLSSSSIELNDKNDTESVKLYAYAVCREYLGGAWRTIDLDDFKIERISGGLSNYLYKCEINPDRFKQISNEPDRILLRLYGENHQKNSSILLKDIVVSAIMSDNMLGPKLYGLFQYGRLEEFINATSMEQNDMYVPEYSRSIAKVMAHFHTLEMPFIKEPSWLFDTITKYMKKSYDVEFGREKDAKTYKKFLEFNLFNEFKELKAVLESINSPVVFCHNDINVGNILKLPNKLQIIDYEYGSYNYRGFDFGNHFCEWMFNNNYDKYPYYQYNYDLYPNREQQLNFLRAYIGEYKDLLQKKKLSNPLDDVDSVTNNILNNAELDEDKLILEANYFALASHLLWSFWGVCQASVCKIKFEYMDYVMARCDAYFKHKNLLFPNGFNNMK